MKILNNQDFESSKDESNDQRLHRLINEFETSPENATVTQIVNEPSANKLLPQSFKKMSSFVTQYNYLFQRASKNAFRNPLIIRAKLGQTIIISLIIGLLYLKTNEKTKIDSAVQDRAGVLFFLAINTVFSNSIGMLSVFGTEKRVFAREHGAGYYSLFSYFSSKVMVEVPFQLVFPIILGYLSFPSVPFLSSP